MNVPFDPIGGSLPASWRFTTIGEICDENDGEVQTGPFGSQLHAGDYVDDGVPTVMPKDIIGDGISTKSIARVPEKDAARLSVHRLRAGDIVYARRGDIGRRAIVTNAEEGWLCGTGCLRIRLNAPGVSPEYLLAYLGHPSVRAWVESKAQGATMLNLNTAILRSVPFRVPPLPEQRRIADILDKADAIRRKRKEAIALTEQLLRSVFLEMFGDPVTNPKGWDVKPLRELLQDIESGWSPVCLARPAVDNEWGVLKLGALTTGRFIDSENKALGPEHAPIAELEVKTGEVLFARKNTYEHVAACVLVARTRARLMMSDLVFRLVLAPDAGMLPSVLWAMVSHPSQRKQIQSLAGGTAGSMPNISKERLRTVLLPVPPKDVQLRFERAAAQFEELRAMHVAAAAESENLFASVVHRAFRGELLGSAKREPSHFVGEESRP